MMTPQEFVFFDFSHATAKELLVVCRDMSGHSLHSRHFEGYTKYQKKGKGYFLDWLKDRQRKVAIDEGLI